MNTPPNAIVLPNSGGYQRITLRKNTSQRLPEMMPSELNSATKFTVDHSENSNAYKTCNVDYACISATNVEHVRTAPNVDVVSHWTLSSRSNGTACVNLASVLKEDKKFSKAWHESDYGTLTVGYPDLSCGQTPVTYNYYKNGLLKKVYDLSAEIFNKYEFHLPSYVGMIVCSGTLGDENAVRKIYGKNTRWKQISFSFMCGQTETGNTEANSYYKYGHMEPYEFSAQGYELNRLGYSSNSVGQEHVVLTEENLINHTHLLSAAFQKFDLQWKGAFEILNEDSKLTDEIKIWKILKEIELKPEDVWVLSGTTPPAPGSKKVADYAKISLEALQWKVTGGESVTSEDFYGNDVEISPEIYSEDGEKINITQVYHKNMPPFETKYVWERIS